MLTGDNIRTAHTIAAQADVDEVASDLKPEDKVERVLDLARRYGPVLMVGDGVNDAPALAAASVGVAMGAAGTDVALETADVALMADDLEKLVDALRLARRNQTVVRQNLAPLDHRHHGPGPRRTDRRSVADDGSHRPRDQRVPGHRQRLEDAQGLRSLPSKGEQLRAREETRGGRGRYQPLTAPTCLVRDAT